MAAKKTSRAWREKQQSRGKLGFLLKSCVFLTSASPCQGAGGGKIKVSGWGIRLIAQAGARLEIWPPAPSYGRNFFGHSPIPDFTALCETSNYLTCFLPWGQDFLHAPSSCGPEKQSICTKVKMWRMILWGQHPLSYPGTQPAHSGAPSLPQPAAHAGASVCFHSSPCQRQPRSHFSELIRPLNKVMPYKNTNLWWTGLLKLPEETVSNKVTQYK